MSRIPDDVIEQIKRTTDLVPLIKGRGIKLRKHGKVYKGCCPFHNETAASFTVTPAKGLWHCFGCDQGGDVIRFVEMVDKLSFREAVNSLKSDQPKNNKQSKAASSLTAEISAAKRTQLLSRVVKFYHQRFLDQSEGIAYLTKERGINNVTLFKNYQIGLSDGSLLEALPQDNESLNLFKALGVLTEKGHELFNGCVVFPLFDDQGSVVNLYGRRIKDGSVNHLYLPGSKVGLWNYQSAKRSTSLLVTESIIDALTLIDSVVA